MTGWRSLPPVAPGQRGDLQTRLVDAAEIEHGLLLQYLFAAFALKQRTDEGLTELELERVRLWKRTILEVAREEMAHLATVCSLQQAIGAVPHLRPPALPAVNRYFGAEAPFRLDPLSPETIDRFVYFERPETDGAGPTVGTLYRTIQRDVLELDAAGGLFAVRGRTENVDMWRISGNVRFGRIADAASAVRAIDAVIEQGEGEAAGAGSHYARFRRIALELRAGAIDPSRPVTERPGASDDATAVAVGRAFAAVYEALLAILARYYDARARDARNDFEGPRRFSVPLMSLLLRPLGEWLTELPAGTQEPGRRAAPAFVPGELEPGGVGATLRREARIMARLPDPRAERIAENLGLAAREADALGAER